MTFNFNSSGILTSAKGVSNEPIPENVVEIAGGNANSYAFMESNTTLTKVSFENGSRLITVGAYAFYSCSALEEVNFENCWSCNLIEERAFQNCTKLSKVIFPPNLEIINTNAFRLTNLNITFDITKLKYLATDAFLGNPISFTCGNGSTKFRQFENNIYNISYNVLAHVSFSTTVLKLHELTTTIGSSAFATSSLTELVIPEQITTLDRFAIHYADYLKTLVLSKNICVLPYQSIITNQRLEGIVIPEGVTNISSTAFGISPKLYYLSFPKTLKYVEHNAFSAIPTISYVTYYPEQFDMLLQAGIPKRALLHLMTQCRKETRNYHFFLFVMFIY